MSFREKFLQQTDSFRKETVTVPGIGDAEIREINSQQRSMIYRAATVTKDSGRNATTEVDPGLLAVWAVICMARDVKSGELIFDKADVEALLEMPISAFDKLSKPALEFLGEDPEEEAKN